MKTCIVLCLFALVAAAVGRPEEKYTDKYDNVDVKEITHNERLFDGYMKCVLDEGKCTPDGNELKSHIIDALETECTKCNEVQKKKIRYVIEFLINEKPEHWERLTAKYDPTKKYAVKYEAELKKIKA